MSKFRVNSTIASVSALVIAVSALSLSVDQASARPAHVVKQVVHTNMSKYDNGTAYDQNGYSAEMGAPEANAMESRIEVPTPNGLRWESIETPAYTD